MGPPKRTARPAACTPDGAANTPAAARKVLRVEIMQRFYPSLPVVGQPTERVPHLPTPVCRRTWRIACHSRGGLARKSPLRPAGDLPDSRWRTARLHAPSLSITICRYRATSTATHAGHICKRGGGSIWVRRAPIPASAELDEEIDRDLEHCREFFCLLLTNGALPAEDL